MNLFNAGIAEFKKHDEVKTDGLGPRMNLHSCAGCHSYPDVAGTSPPEWDAVQESPQLDSLRPKLSGKWYKGLRIELESQMPDRTAIVVSAFFACVALTAVAGPAYAGDACITKPPQGSHWYYHVDPVTRRKCWHQRAEGLTVHQVGSSKPSLPANTISKQGAETDRQQPTANSHTEQPIVEAQPSAPGLTGQSAPATSTGNAGAENPPQSLPSSGWRDQQSSADFHDRERELGRRAATDAGNDSQGRMPTVLTRAQVAAAEYLAQISADRMLLALLVGALALSVATTGRLIFKYAAARGSTWKWTEPTFSASDVSTRRADVVCDLLEPTELSWTEELRQLLERYDGLMPEHRQPRWSRKTLPPETAA